jgi:hypothetical protein
MSYTQSPASLEREALERLVEKEAHGMLDDLVGKYSATTFRVACDHLKQFARRLTTPPSDHAGALAKLTEKERAVYDHYMTGSERGDLFVYVKRGRENIMKPERSMGNAFAAWLAGRTLAAVASPTSDHIASPSPAQQSGELREALIGPGEEDPTLGRFGWLEAFVADFEALMVARPDIRAAWLEADADATFEAEREVRELIREVRAALASTPSSSPSEMGDAP